MILMVVFEREKKKTTFYLKYAGTFCKIRGKLIIIVQNKSKLQI